MTRPMQSRDHGGGLDAAAAAFSGAREDWLDLSTGINPLPYPVGEVTQSGLGRVTPIAPRRSGSSFAARSFWSVPEGAAILPAARRQRADRPPACADRRAPRPHPRPHLQTNIAASFGAAGWRVVPEGEADAQGARASQQSRRPPHGPSAKSAPPPVTIIDESFCDTCPDASHVACASDPGVVVLKSFGKFWGLAGLRLGAMIATSDLCARMARVARPMGRVWSRAGNRGARTGRPCMGRDDAAQAGARCGAARRDDGVRAGRRLWAGQTLFRTYNVEDAEAFQTRLARAQIWVRIFPYFRHMGAPRPAGGRG